MCNVMYRSLTSVHPFLAQLTLCPTPKILCFTMIFNTPQKCPFVWGNLHQHNSTVTLSLACVVKPDTSDVISEGWFYVVTLSFPIFCLKYGINDAGVKKLAFWSHFQSENGNKYSRCTNTIVFPGYVLSHWSCICMHKLVVACRVQPVLHWAESANTHLLYQTSCHYCMRKYIDKFRVCATETPQLHKLWICQYNYFHIYKMIALRTNMICILMGWWKFW